MSSERLLFSSKDKLAAITAVPVILFVAESVVHNLSRRKDKQKQINMNRDAEKRSLLELAEDSNRSGDFNFETTTFYPV